MTIHKLTAGDGYTYLTRQVAGADVPKQKDQTAADYYTARGNPPGRWIGRGAPLLGLAGERVTEEQMRALFGRGQHPDAEAIIGAHLAAHVLPGMTGIQLAEVRRYAVRAAALGRPFPRYAPLQRFDVRVPKRLEIITEETGREPTAAEIRRCTGRRRAASGPRWPATTRCSPRSKARPCCGRWMNGRPSAAPSAPRTRRR
jgi:hypothetical protein